MNSRRKFALLGALVGGLYGLTWIDLCPTPGGEITVVSRVRGDGPLRVGAAQVSLSPTLPVPLAAYRPFRPDAENFKRPLYARATVFEAGDAKLGVLSLELMLVPEALASELRDRARSLGLSDLVVVATHTHSSFGGYDRRPVFELAAIGRFRSDIERTLLEASTEALKQAAASVRDAKLEWAEADFPELVVARSEGMAPKGRLSAARFVDARGAPVAQWILLGAHPTTVPKSVPRLDGDWAGALALKEEGSKLGITSVFQSEGGNASAATFDAEPEDKAERIANEVAADVNALPLQLDQKHPARLRFIRASALPPPVDVQRIAPLFLRGLGRQAVCKTLPATTQMSLLEVAGHRFLFVPAEPTQGAGEILERAAGGAHSISLADGYLGYVETPEAVRLNQGEARRQYFDASMLSHLERTAETLVKESGP